MRDVVSVVNFWGRRWFRTLPNYYFYLLVHLVLAYPLVGLGAGLIEQNKFVIFTQAWAWPHPPFFAEAWSLAIEEWYYLLSPLMLFLLLRMGLEFRTAFFVVVVVLLFVPVGFRVWLATVYPEQGFEVHRKVVMLRLDAIMYGMLIAMLHGAQKERLYAMRWLLFLVSVGLFAGTTYYNFFVGKDINVDVGFKVVVLALIPLAGAFLIPVIMTTRERRGCSAAFFRFTASLSYSLYLCNLLVLSYLLPAMVKPLLPPGIWGGGGALAGFVLLSYGVAYLSYRHIEKPMLRLRDRILPSVTCTAR
jgi:peptidoglycan/LPS O-acetylase OafA/YrhL